VEQVNRRGVSLIELLIVTVIGLLVLEAAYLLYMGGLRLFKDVKTTSDNVQTLIPSMELIDRYFDRWGVGVYETGSGTNCSTYPPSSTRCITKTAQSGLGTGVACDEVIFWGNLYGTGFVSAVTGTSATLASCRLSTTAGHNCQYVWQKGSTPLLNDLSTGVPIPLALSNTAGSGPLTPNNADCSALSSTSTTNATVNSTLTPWTGATNKILVAGNIITRAPHRIRLYCAANANDGNKNWLYVDLTDTASGCGSNESASPVAPVNSFQVTLLPASCTASSGGCTAAQTSVTFRSQSKKASTEYGTQTVQKVFGR
jgi:prepilin-type N-terminal cleavage/methylation domain-containing protein